MFTTANARTGRYEPLDWGPARHDPEHPLHTATYDPFDLRDDAGLRPDDN